jgi:putative phosphoesterase
MSDVRELRIAVIADTHDNLSARVIDAIRFADEIWHLGDVTSENVIESLLALGPRLRVVRGNCDGNEDWPLEETVELNSKRFRLMHIPPKAALAEVDVVLHGHTHVPRDEKLFGIRFLNPGTAGGPSKGAPPSYAWLTIGDNLTWEVVRI